MKKKKEDIVKTLVAGKKVRKQRINIYRSETHKKKNLREKKKNEKL